MKRTCECTFALDPDSGRAIYLQLRDHIIAAIAGDLIREGDCLPSVRQLAREIGVNMHTVNKAYALLAEEGFVSVEPCKGAVIVIDGDHEKALMALREQLRITLLEAVCRGVSREEVCRLVDEFYENCGCEKE